MTTTVIVAIAVGILITALLLIYVVHWRRRGEDIKRHQVNTLSNRVRRLDTIASGVPSQYINKKVHLLIVQIAIDLLKQLKELDPGGKYSTLLKEWELLAKKINTGESVGSPITGNSELKEKEIRQNLKALFNFIKKQIELGKLDSKFGKQQLAQTQFFVLKSLADTHMRTASLAEKNKDYRLAIHHIHNAIETFAKAGGYPATKKIVTDYRQRIKSLNKKAEKKLHKEEVSPTSANTLSAQLEQLAEKEDVWKRKQDYEP